MRKNGDIFPPLSGLAVLLALLASLAPRALAQTTAVPPVITQQPASVTTNEYRNVFFSVTATGTPPLAYKWSWNGNSIRDATNAALPVFAADLTNAGAFSVVITNIAGSVTSSNAILTVIGPPSITRSPISVTTIQGATVTFKVVVLGTPLPSYQWQFNNTNLPGATNASLTLSNVQINQAGAYRVIVSNLLGSANSSPAILTVNIPPAITQEPVSVTTNQDATVGFNVAASGTPPLQYQWLFGGNPISGATNTSFSLTSVQLTNTGNYQVLVTGPGGSVTSSNAVLTVLALALPTITAQPTNQAVLVWNPVAFSVSATGLAPLQYQWLFDGGPILGATNLAFILNAAQFTNAGVYQVVVTGPGGSVTSSNAVLNVLARELPMITTQPTNQSVDSGSAVTFIVNATGLAPLQYQWLFDGSPIFSATNSSLSLIAAQLTNAGIYEVVVTGPQGSVVSSYASLVVLAPLSITQQPASQTNLAGANVAFRVEVSGPGPFKYQWQFNGTKLPNNLITTVAGNGAGGYSGDGGLAINTSLYYPGAAAVDVSGNLFIADAWNHRIRKVDVNGIITTAAGNGSGGFAGDGGAATNARLYYPHGVAVDAAGNLFIADNSNNRVRKVDNNGIITTVAGVGAGGYSGDGAPATNANLSSPQSVALDTAGNLFIADVANQRIRKVDVSGFITTVAGSGPAGFSGDGGAATNASLNYPVGVAVDSLGDIFIADFYNQRIRKVDFNGNITTVAGSGTEGYSGDGGQATNATLNDPIGVAVDFSGNIFIADEMNNRIRQVDTNGIITTAAGGGVNFPGDGGAATNAILGSPTGDAVDASGNLFIAEQFNQYVQKVAFGGYPNLTFNAVSSNAGNYQVIITSPYGSVTSSVATLTVQVPPSILSQPVNAFAVAGGTAAFMVGAKGDPVMSYSWYFNGTNLVATGTNSTLFLPNASPAEVGNYFVVVTNPFGSVTSQVAAVSLGDPPTITTQPLNQTVAAFSNPTLTVGASGTGPLSYQWQLNGTNLLNDIITTVAGNGKEGDSGNGGAATNASLNYPAGVAIDRAGNLFIADSANNVIRKVGFDGTITIAAGNGVGGYSGEGGSASNASLNFPVAVAVDSSGNLFIADELNNLVRKVDANGIITTAAGGGTNFPGDGGLATNASLNFPKGVAVDGYDNVYFADYNHNRVRKVDSQGVITTVAGNGAQGFSGDGGAATDASLGAPSGVAVDAAGSFFIADYSNGRIRKVDFNGIITTVAGGGTTYPGDGGAATNASLGAPSSVALDASGNLFISDYSHALVRKAATNGIITTVAGGGTNYPGDGGAGTNARLLAPSGVATDASGNLFIADTLHQRVREVALPGLPILTLAAVSSGNAGNYQVIVSNPYGSATSVVASLTVQTAPYIVAQPADVNLLAGSTAVFEVGAVGDPPMSYSWYFDARNLVQTGTNSNLTLAKVTVGEAGAYTVVITNAFGSVTSAVARLADGSPPVFTQQPISQTVFAFSTVTLSVGISGTGPFNYQWQFAFGDVSNGTNLLEDLPSLTITNFSRANVGNYQVLVTAPYGRATSTVARLTIDPDVIPIQTPVLAGNNLIISFTPLHPSSSYSLLYARNITGPWTKINGAAITINPLTGDYQFSFGIVDYDVFFRVRSP